MLILIQVLIILILTSILIIVYIDELRDTRRKVPHAKVEEIWLGEERRKTPRVKTKLDVTYSFYKGGGQPKKTHTENISMGGAKIQIEEKLEKGIPLLLKIKLPNMAKPIIAKAETVWVEENPEESSLGKKTFTTGIKFIHINPAEQKELSTFIENLLASQ